LKIYSKKKIKTLLGLTREIKVAVACCCSELRYRKINRSVSKIEDILEGKKSEPVKD